MHKPCASLRRWYTCPSQLPELAGQRSRSHIRSAAGMRRPVVPSLTVDSQHPDSCVCCAHCSAERLRAETLAPTGPTHFIVLSNAGQQIQDVAAELRDPAPGRTQLSGGGAHAVFLDAGSGSGAQDGTRRDRRYRLPVRDIMLYFS